MNLYQAKEKHVLSAFSMNHGKSSECLRCGLCEKNCPQRIVIRDMLKEFSALYEGV